MTTIPHDYYLQKAKQMTVAFLSVVWCLLASWIGKVEAIHFWLIRNNEDRPEEHPQFTIERILMIIPFIIAMHTPGHPITWLNGLMLPFLFVMWHDGIYYLVMNKMAKCYPKGFWDFSTKSTAWMDRKRLTLPWLRVTYFVIGVVGLILINTHSLWIR